jgi:hypothetical protein
MDTCTDKLLESLSDITCQSKQILQEGSSTIDRILQLGSRLSGNIGGDSLAISSTDRELIDNVKKIRINDDYKVSSYSNIHNIKKYGIHAECNVEYVIEEILNHIENPKSTFNPKEINERAIAKTFHKLTNITYQDKTMSTDEFKDEYRSVAFGGFRKEMILPNIIHLSRLYERSPYIVNYINNRLIFSHINSLKNYYSKIEDSFNNIAKNNPNMNVSLEGYLACLDTSIRNTLIMYKAIRSTFIELCAEYKNIFNEILSIDRELKDQNLNESTLNFYNSLFEDVDILNNDINNLETLLNESISNNENLKLSKEQISKSKSFKSLIDKFSTESNINSIGRDIALNNIKDYYGIISRISNEDLINIDREYKIYSNILNTIDMNNFISIINTKIGFCKNQFSNLNENQEKLESITKYDILKEILSDISLCDIPDNQDNMLGKIIDGINAKIFNKHIITKITDLSGLFDNILNIPKYCETINNHIKDVSNMIIDIMNKNMENNNIYKMKLVNDKIINAYIGYNLILTCIFYNLLKFENSSLELVQALIDEIE